MSKLVLGCIVLLVFLGACGSSSEVGGLRLSLSPTSLQVGDNQVEVAIVDPQGKAVSDAEVSLEAVHKTMRMERNVVNCSGGEEGRYQGTVKTAHSGSWVILVEVSRGGRRLGRAEFPVEVK